MSVEIPEAVGVLAGQLEVLLEDRLLGVYLGGSFSMDDWTPTSDYDVLVVTDGALRPRDLHELRRFHDAMLSFFDDASRLEGDYAPRHLLVPQGTLVPVPGIRDGIFIPRPAEVMLSADNIANMRAHGIPVYGPDPKAVLPELTPDDVRAAVREMLIDVPAVVHSEAKAAEEVLDMLRSLRTVETGEPTTKSQGVEWGLASLDPRWHPAIRLAASARHGTAPPEDERVLRSALAEMVRALVPDA